MNSVAFLESNCKFSRPTDLEEVQCNSVDAWRGAVVGGTLDGAMIVVTAWVPNADELKLLNEGKPIFMSMLGGLAPHYLSTDFHTATHPA